MNFGCVPTVGTRMYLGTPASFANMSVVDVELDQRLGMLRHEG